jgi:hypothetical protein
MKCIKGIGLILSMSLIISSCKNSKEVEVFDPMSALDFIPENIYYENDIFQNENNGIYGVWESIYNVQNGINGPITLSSDFDYLIVKPNAIFGIIKNEELIATGKLTLVNNQNNDLFGFVCECDINEVNVKILLYDNVEIELDLENSRMRILYPNGETYLIRSN